MSLSHDNGYTSASSEICRGTNHENSTQVYTMSNLMLMTLSRNSLRGCIVTRHCKLCKKDKTQKCALVTELQNMRFTCRGSNHENSTQVSTMSNLMLMTWTRKRLRGWSFTVECKLLKKRQNPKECPCDRTVNHEIYLSRIKSWKSVHRCIQRATWCWSSRVRTGYVGE